MPASPSATAEHIKDVNTRYHDAASSSYDAKWGIDFGPIGQEQVRSKLRKALGHEPGRYADALEVGAGTGYFGLNLMQAGVVGRLTATDISPGMLASLAEAAEGLGLAVETEVSEAEALPFADASFDLVFGHAILHHIPDLARAFGEAHALEEAVAGQGQRLVADFLVEADGVLDTGRLESLAGAEARLELGLADVRLDAEIAEHV